LSFYFLCIIFKIKSIKVYFSFCEFKPYLEGLLKGDLFMIVLFTNKKGFRLLRLFSVICLSIFIIVTIRSQNIRMKVYSMDPLHQMEGFRDWPEGFSREETNFAFGDPAFDGKHVWFVPFGSDRVVKVDKDTGEMVGFNNWPVGFQMVENAFASAVFDGEYIWMIPFNADGVVKIHKDTGEMTAFTNWPEGFIKGNSAFKGSVFDGEYIWMIPNQADRVIKIHKDTGWMTGFDNWPREFYKTSYYGAKFSGGLLVDDHIWMVPLYAAGVVMIHRETGEMKEYRNWPSGFSLKAKAFLGGVFDGENVWLIPSNADAVLQINKDTLQIKAFNNWPEGFTKGVDSFHGGVFDGESIWMVPYASSDLIKMDKVSGDMILVNNYPSGFVKGNYGFHGGVFDGKDIWLSPFTANMVVKIIGKGSVEADTISLVSDEAENDFRIDQRLIEDAAKKNASLSLKTSGVEMVIPNEVLKAEMQLDENEEIFIQMSQKVDQVTTQMIEKTKESINQVVHISNLTEFSMIKMDEEKNQEYIREFSTPLKITLKDIQGFNDLSKTGVYNVIPVFDEKGNVLEVKTVYSGGQVQGKDMVFYTDHFSFYLVMERRATFPDMTTSWARNNVEKLASLGIIRGYPDGLFLPNNQVNRVDFSVMLNNSLGKKPMEYTVAFRDVKQGDYFAGHVLSLNKLGISDVKASLNQGQVSSASLPSFRVYNSNGTSFERITREETATFIANAYNYLRTFRQELPLLEPQSLDYKDSNQISNEEMKKNISIAYQLGIMKGYPDGTFKPKNVLTRAEAATCIVLFMDKFNVSF
jgi:hypothetical protein